MTQGFHHPVDVSRNRRPSTTWQAFPVDHNGIFTRLRASRCDDCDDARANMHPALAESCIAGRIGADVHLHDDLHPVASLFGETQSRIVVTVADEDADTLVDRLVAAGVPYSVIGTVGGTRLTVCGRLDVALDDLREAFDSILDELSSQYLLAYSPTARAPDGRWHRIRVEVAGGRYDVRARRGYRYDAAAPQPPSFPSAASSPGRPR